jgi:predicted NBD/HSP70 family sugar kinase
MSGDVVHRGADGAAGDIGHIRVAQAEGTVCVCGNTGCLEAVASGSALVRELSSAGVPVTTVRDVITLAQAGDARVVRAVRVAGQRIGEVVASIVNFYNPNAIVVGGALAELQDDLLAGIRSVVYQRALPLATRKLTIEPSVLGGSAGVQGAAVLAARAALSPVGITRWLTKSPSSRK